MASSEVRHSPRFHARLLFLSRTPLRRRQVIFNRHDAREGDGAECTTVHDFYFRAYVDTGWIGGEGKGRFLLFLFFFVFPLRNGGDALALFLLIIYPAASLKRGAQLAIKHFGGEGIRAGMEGFCIVYIITGMRSRVVA